LADDLSITPGSGKTIAADDVSSVYYQRVKISWGVDGSAVDASNTNPFPVYLASVGNTQPVSGTVAATQSGTWNVTNISGTITLPTGAATSAKQDTAAATLAAIQTAAEAIQDAAEDTTTDSPVIVHTPCDVISVTPTLDTSIYASGDTLFVATAISGAVRAADLRSNLSSIAVIDKDDQKPALRLLFFKAAVTFGTLNAAPSISDSDAANYLGHYDIAAADYVDLGGVSVACARNVGLLLESASGTTNVYVAAMLTAGTPTHTASGLVFNFGVIHS
jgi:hypothetical protein